MITNIFNVA